MKTSVQNVTPAMATKWLKGNSINRRINNDRVDRLAATILAGEWKLNGDTIRMNGNRLIDGQHRLLAVIKAGKSIKTLVITDLPSEVFDTIDVGMPRTSAHTLQAMQEKNANAVAAALRSLRGVLGGSLDNQGRISNTEIISGLAQHPGIRNSVTFVSKHRVAMALGRISVLSALHYLFSKKDAVLADLFVGSLDDGSGITDRDPIHLLRQRLIQNRLSPAKLNQNNIASMTIKVWNAMRSGEKLKQLKVVSGEAIPKIL